MDVGRRVKYGDKMLSKGINFISGPKRPLMSGPKKTGMSSGREVKDQVSRYPTGIITLAFIVHYIDGIGEIQIHVHEHLHSSATNVVSAFDAFTSYIVYIDRSFTRSFEYHGGLYTRNPAVGQIGRHAGEFFEGGLWIDGWF
jgi:hypothetical protein